MFWDKWFKKKVKFEDLDFDFTKLATTKKDEPDERDYMYSTMAEATVEKLPKKVDLRSKMPPIYTQYFGCCASCAALGADQFIYKYKTVPSLPFTYYCVHDIEKNPHDVDDGSTLS